MTAKKKGLVYDAPAVRRILGLPVSLGAELLSVPPAADGEIVVYYGGWDLPTLRKSAAGQKRMWQNQNWYDASGWKAVPGYYRLRVPVPHSNGKTFEEQEQLLSSGEQSAPVVLVATAMLAHRLQTGESLLKNDFTRCKEQAAGGSRVELVWDGGRLSVDDDLWGDDPGGGVWSSSVRTS